MAPELCMECATQEIEEGFLMQRTPLTFTAPVAATDVLSHYELFRTRDRDEARQWGQRVFCDNALDYRTSADTDAYMYYRQAGSVGLGRMSYGSEVVISPVDMESFILFQIPVTGSEAITQKGRTVITNSSTGSFINSGEPVTVHHQKGTEKLIVRINRDTLEQYCQQYLGRMLTSAIEFAPVIQTTDNPGLQWMRTLSWAYDILSVPDMKLAPIIEKQIEQSVVSLLLHYQPHSFSQEMHREDSDICPAFIRRAKEFIEAHATQAISVTDIAVAAGVSTRSLYSGFRKYSRVSPSQFIKDIRLNLARAQLKEADNNITTVTDIAINCGFNHLGHFTADYKKRFGETPSQTLNR